VSGIFFEWEEGGGLGNPPYALREWMEAMGVGRDSHPAGSLVSGILFEREEGGGLGKILSF